MQIEHIQEILTVSSDFSLLKIKVDFRDKYSDHSHVAVSL